MGTATDRIGIGIAMIAATGPAAGTAAEIRAFP
jgi:hypothetical protein